MQEVARNGVTRKKLRPTRIRNGNMKTARNSLFGLSLLVFLLLGCSFHGNPKTHENPLAQFDFIATIDNSNYYWEQIEDVSGWIYKEDSEGTIDTCKVYGYVFGALPAPIEVDTMPVRGGSVFSAVPSREQIAQFSNRYFFIDLGEEGYMLFDASLFPRKLDLLNKT